MGAFNSKKCFENKSYLVHPPLVEEDKVQKTDGFNATACKFSNDNHSNVSCSNLSAFTPVHNESSITAEEKDKNKHSILVSASEVQRAQEVVSSLRHKHGIHVVSSKSGIDVGASYMVSPRCAVLRISTQEFCNATNRSDLTSKCQKMNDLFDRPWLVVETEKKHADCMNPDDIVVTSTHQLFGKGERTKYIDNLLAQLSQSKLKVLFSILCNGHFKE